MAKSVFKKVLPNKEFFFDLLDEISLKDVTFLILMPIENYYFTIFILHFSKN